MESSVTAHRLRAGSDVLSAKRSRDHRNIRKGVDFLYLFVFATH